MDWQPIETASAKGEPVLLYLRDPIDSNGVVGWASFDDLYIVVGWNTGDRFSDGTLAWQCGFCDEGSADTEGRSSSYMIDITPTHWMPLPEPPK